jgi:molecular chaperone Hsp33
MTTSSATGGSKDTLQKFIFDNAAVRGEFVEISDTWREVQARHDYPAAVKTVLVYPLVRKAKQWLRAGGEG